MPNNYIAPYLISDDPAQTYEGMFTVPICTTRERFDKIMNALWSYGAMQGDEADFDHLVDWLDALPRITEGCVTFGEQCRTLSRDDARITWYPTIDAETLPAGYVVNPWVVLTGDNPLVGLKGGDVITDILHLPPLPTIYDHLEDIGSILALGYPSITISGLTGNGKIRVYLVNILLGGKVITVKDNNLLTFAFLDTNLDTASLPPETYAEIILEFDFEGEIEHSLNLVFVPNVNDSFEFLGYGGGFRRVEICGFGGTDMAEEGCCDETNQLLGLNNELLSKIYLMMKKGFEIHPIGFDQPPDTISLGTCAPEKYDQDGSDDEPTAIFRAAVLCYVTYCYVMVILVKALSQMGMPLPALGILFPLYATSPTALQKVKVEYPEVLSVIALITGIPAGGALIELVVCQMVARLRGQFNTFDIFKTSLDVFGGVGTLAIPVSGLVNATNQNYDNWLAFGEALVQGMDMATEVDAYTCPCTQDCTTDLELQIVNGRGTFAKVEGTDDLYHFTGTATYPVDVDLHGGVYIRDAFGRCMTVWMALDGETGVPVGWTDQGVLYHHVIGCCGTENSTGLLGGFAGTLEGDQKYTEFYWDRQDQAVDTYLHVKCFEC